MKRNIFTQTLYAVGQTTCLLEIILIIGDWTTRTSEGLFQHAWELDMTLNDCLISVFEILHGRCGAFQHLLCSTSLSGQTLFCSSCYACRNVAVNQNE